MTQAEHDEYFGEDVELGSEYSIVKECGESESGFHCSCYDHDGECCLCESALDGI